MCLVFIAYKKSAKYRWILAGNRDEFHNRPTAPLSFIDKDERILGGRDLQEGGMWLGVSRDGRFGVITNYRDGGAPVLPDRPSRGEIVYQFLESGISAVGAVESLAEKSSRYAGFNVIFGDGDELVYFSNRQNEIRILPPGFYGLSNRLLDSRWPKVVRGKELLENLMSGFGDVDFNAILEKLKDAAIPPDDALPDTGVGLELERFLSPIMIVGENYGTRSSAVVSMDCTGKIEFVERSYIPDQGGPLVSSEIQKSMQADDEFPPKER